MQSKAKTVAQYLGSLTSDQREVIAAVRTVILANLDAGFEEGMQYGMLGYAVPHRLYPAGYHCDPKQQLPFAALAAQKNYFALHLMSLYMNPEETKWFTDAWKAAGKKLDMGKACVRFKKLDDLALDVVGQAIRRMPTNRWIEIYEASLASRSAKPSKAAKSSKPAAKAPAKAASKAKAAAKKAPVQATPKSAKKPTKPAPKAVAAKPVTKKTTAKKAR